MRFESPMMLLGMLAAAIPIIIHLINRRRAKLVPFAAIEFLLASDKRLARRLKIKQLLVLALRVGLLLAIPFALAKPYVPPDELEALSAAAPGSVVLVVDDSWSMQVRDGEGTRLDQALDRARQIVASGGPETNFAVVASGRPARVLTPELTYDKTTVERALSRIVPAPRAADMAEALREAERVLAKSEQPSRRVHLIGDQAAHAWAGVTQPWALARVPPHEIVTVGSPEPPRNLAITNVQVRRAASGQRQLEVVVSVSNDGASGVETQVELEAGGRVFGGRVDVGAGAVVEKVFSLPWDDPSASLRGIARLGREGQAPDALAADDSWYFTADFGGVVQVGVVNGAPRAVPHQDELFFLRHALAPGGSTGGDRFQTVFLDKAELGTAKGSLDHLDVVILANVGSLSDAARVALKSFVEAGGGLLITGGDQLSPESNRAYGDLMPFPIRDIKEVARRDDPSAVLSTLTIGNVDFNHPAMAEFEIVEDASLFHARVYTYALIDARMREGTRVVASFTGGVPGLVEASLGRGRTMMLTTTIDRDWSDLAIRTSFLPLVHQLVLYLSGKLERQSGASLMVGEPAVVPIPEGDGPVVVQRPDGVEVTLTEEVAPDQDEITVVETDVVGHYLVRRTAGRGEEQAFSVNADRAESRLSRADPKALEELLATPGTGTALPGAEEPGAEAEGGLEDSNRTPIWPVILVLLFGLLASEAWLVLRS